MKILTTLLVLSLAPALFGQHMVDQVGRVPCDDLYAKSSALAQETANEKGSRALVTGYPKIEYHRLVVAQFRQILANFEFAGLEDHVDFVIGKERPDVMYEFWVIPPGTKPPEREGVRWSPAKYDVTRAFLFDTVDEIGECPTFVPRKFAEVVASVPGSRVNIVIRHGDRNSLPSHGFAEDTVNDLIKAHVPRSRIRVFYMKGNSALTYAEIWFVPPRH